MSDQFDPVESILFQQLDILSRPALGFDVYLLAGVLQHLPIAGDACYLAVLDLVHVYGFTIVWRRYPAKLVLVTVRRNLVFGAQRRQDLRLFRHRPAGCGLLVVVTPVTQTDVVPRRESELVERLRSQTLDDIYGT